MFMADDMTFETYGWDKKIEDAFDAIPDKIALVFFNEDGADSQFGIIGCLHKNWVDTVGYLFKPDIIRKGDRWISEIAHHLNRRVYLHDVIFKNKDIRDATRREYVAEANASNHAEYYKTLKKIRNQDIKLLRRFIENFKSGV